MKRLELDLKKTSADCASILGDRFYLGVLAESDTATLISSTILGVINKIICPESGLKMSLTGDKKLLIDKKEGKNDAKVGYLVYTKGFRFSGHCKDDRFITMDHNFAEKWCNKFNKIVNDYRYNDDRDITISLWFDTLTQGLFNVEAKFEEIEIR